MPTGLSSVPAQARMGRGADGSCTGKCCRDVDSSLLLRGLGVRHGPPPHETVESDDAGPAWPREGFKAIVINVQN